MVWIIFCEILTVPVFNLKASKQAVLFCFITYFYKELEDTQSQDVHVLFICEQERQDFLHSVPRFLVAWRGNNLSMKGVMKEFLSLYLHQPTTKAEVRENTGFSKSSQLTEVRRHFIVITEITFLFIDRVPETKPQLWKLGQWLLHIYKDMTEGQQSH